MHNFVYIYICKSSGVSLLLKNRQSGITILLAQHLIVTILSKHFCIKLVWWAFIACKMTLKTHYHQHNHNHHHQQQQQQQHQKQEKTN